MRPSLHVEPEGLVATTRHYIRDLVYGANDGVITTFAVVAGVTGGALSPRAVLIVGAANLFPGHLRPRDSAPAPQRGRSDAA